MNNSLRQNTIRLTPGPLSPLVIRKKKLPLSVRFALRSPKKGNAFSNPHPLEIWLSVNGERAHFGAVWKEKKLMVNPEQWQVDQQKSARRGDPVNRLIISVRAHVELVYQTQLDQGGAPTLLSIQRQLLTGETPEWYNQIGWVFPSDKKLREEKGQHAHCICADSPIDEAIVAYIAHLNQQKGGNGLERIALGRWHRCLFLVREFSVQTRQALPTSGKISLGWAKRFHAWMQSMPLTERQNRPISDAQASRFIHQVSNVLSWMVEEDWVVDNPIKKVSWPRYDDKEVLFLEPEHVHRLLGLRWKGNKGAALWWFCLMCCTGMDYPDAVAYARNRKAFEIEGVQGLKIVGRRKKPPHVEYHLPLLPEVDELFKRYARGPKLLSGDRVNRYTDQIEEELGISWRITAKIARKTFGCLMLAAGHRIADISLMLGHSNIMTTERHYVKVRGSSIDRAMKRVKVSIGDLAQARLDMQDGKGGQGYE